MKLLKISNILKDENILKIKKWIKSCSPEKRKIFLKYISKRNLIIDFYNFINTHKMSKLFLVKKNTNASKFSKDYLKNLYWIMCQHRYKTCHEVFYNFWGLNKEEINYIDNLFFIEEDYNENHNYKSIVKGICENYYTIDQVEDFLNIKYKDILKHKIYNDMQLCLNYIKKTGVNNIFKIPCVKNIKKVQNIREKFLNKAIDLKFNHDLMITLDNEYRQNISNLY